MARLRLEVEAWQQDGTVTAEQGQSILARYPEYAPGYEASRRRQSLVVGLSILGAILIGLSVITFFAANWNEISRGVKLGSLFVGMALSYGSGYYLWNRAGYGAYAVALVLLGCIIYGAGVHLIGQIYHIDVDNPNLSMFWFLGVAPLAYATRSRPVMVLAIVVFLAAVGFRAAPGWRRLPAQEFRDPYCLRPSTFPLQRSSTRSARPRNCSKGGNPSAASSRPSGCLSALARFTCSPSMTSSITKATVAAA